MLVILDFKISEHDISPADDKVTAIRSFRESETKKKVRGFSVVHILGAGNISDIFSRLCQQTDLPFDETSEHYVCQVGEGSSAITLNEIK